MDINNEIKSLPLFKEIDKYANEIKCIFKEYNFNVEKEEIMPFASIAMFYEAHITSKAENIAKDIELYFFLNKNEEVCKLQSINNKEYYTLNNIQLLEYKNFLLKKINKDLSDHIDFISKQCNRDFTNLKKAKIPLEEWYDFIKNSYVSIEEKDNKELLIIRSIYNFAPKKGFITHSENKKGTNAITNVEASLIYDIMFFIKNKYRDNILSTKEKSDCIRYRLNKIMGKNHGRKSKYFPKI